MEALDKILLDCIQVKECPFQVARSISVTANTTLTSTTVQCTVNLHDSLGSSKVLSPTLHPLRRTGM